MRFRLVCCLVCAVCLVGGGRAIAQPVVGGVRVLEQDDRYRGHVCGDSAVSMGGRRLAVIFQTANKESANLLYYVSPDGAATIYTRDQLQELGGIKECGWYQGWPECPIPRAVIYLADERHVFIYVERDSTDAPRILTMIVSRGGSPSDGYEEPVTLDWHRDPRTQLGPGMGANIGNALRAGLGADGLLHVLAVPTIYREQGGDSRPFIHGVWDGAVWTCRVLAELDPQWQISGAQFGLTSDGRPHFVVRNVLESGSRLTDQYEYHHLTQAGWQKEDIISAAAEEWNHPLDPSPSLATYPDGRVGLAWTLWSQVQTGSIMYSHLRYSVRETNGNWQTSTIMQTADNFCGNDGCGHTGGHPELLIDAAGRAHILFTDTGRSHLPEYGQLAWEGNLRYASNSGSGWRFNTIVRQPSVPHQASDDDYFVSTQDYAMTPGGDRVVAFGATLYNDRNAEGSVDTQLVQIVTVDLTHPALVAVPTPSAVDYLVRRAVPVDRDGDASGDGLLDAADVRRETNAPRN